ncbi:Rab-interacting lysosomal protein [Heterocephalus glaber]|uniref:Rab-interacting lysosomal protein n=1 Tax=Heterocephalus glaber TaxID=10181 RepID=G5BCV4_HETGA|nr:Rab-interacting lysosomal protein [Heterocephalus glaber]
MDPRRAAPGALGWGPRVAAGSGTAAELVYHLAGALGAELQELASRFGPEATAGLVPLVVRALELLEKAAVGPAPDSVSPTLPSLPPAGPVDPKPDSGPPQLQVSAQQAEVELRRLREENEHLRREARAGPQEERALLRQLKEVTDRQRDELRAHGRDLQERSQEIEALQEQLQRLLLVNAELHRKLAAVQAQLRAAQERERERELPRDGAREPAEEQKQEPQRAPPKDLVDASRQPSPPTAEAGPCSFSREELEQILQERNELKTKVFLLKEELAYFQRRGGNAKGHKSSSSNGEPLKQRELLTDHRVPGLLLEAMKITVRKQRKKIKAKMLGTAEEAESSFGLWYRSEAEATQAKTSRTSPSALGE